MSKVYQRNIDRVLFKTAYQGLPLHLTGRLRGCVDSKESAKILGLTDQEYLKVLGTVKGMYTRQPESTISVIDYVKKLKEAGLTPDDIGCSKGKYQAGRDDDQGSYHSDNWNFILMEDNLLQRNDHFKNDQNKKSVNTPAGIFESAIEAARQLDINVATVNNRIKSGDADFKDWYYVGSLPEKIIARLRKDGKRFYASDNIHEYIEEYNQAEIINDIASQTEKFLQYLMIDIENDPNSKDTARRISRMYFEEIMRGRYYPAPQVTAFPNDDPNPSNRYSGIITVRTELLSVCSHHHQPVKGVCFIGLIPSTRVIGLSKYSRIVKHLAARGTLQEQLTNDVADAIIKHTGSTDVAVHIAAEHGCMVHRGIEAHSSLTQTTVLRGQFFKHDIKDEFLKYLQMQQQHARP